MALSTSTTLNVAEKRELAKLEKRIESKLADFLIVGSDLKQIRDGKLYRPTHKTFEAYVKQRFEIERAYAYRLIESAEVIQDLS